MLCQTLMVQRCQSQYIVGAKTRIASRIQTVWAVHPRGNPCRWRPTKPASLANRASVGWFILGPILSALISNRVSCLPFRRHCSRDFHPVSYTHLRAHETVLDLVCRLLLEK